jgi:hypothetical protein
MGGTVEGGSETSSPTPPHSPAGGTGGTGGAGGAGGAGGTPAATGAEHTATKSEARTAVRDFATTFGVTITQLNDEEQTVYSTAGTISQASQTAFNASLNAIEGKNNADAIYDVATNLKAALTSTTSIYNTEKVKALLSGKTLTLADLASLQGKTGDELIKALIELFDLDPRQFENQYVQAFNTLMAAGTVYTEGDITSNPAYRTFRGDTSGLIQEFADKIDRAEAALENIAATRAAAIASVQSDIEAVATLRDLLSIFDGQKPLIEENQNLSDAVATKLAALVGSDATITLADLRQAVESYGAKLDDATKAAIGELALRLITENPTSVSPADVTALGPYLQLDVNQQRLVMIDVDSQTYVLLLEKNSDGEWTIASEGMAGYYVEEDKGKLVVGRSVDWATDPTYVVTDIPLTGTPHIPRAGSTQWVLGTNGNQFIIEWVDADGQGDLDIETELASAVILNADGTELGPLSEKFALLADHGMVAGSEGLGNSSLTKEEMEAAAAVIGRYASGLGMSFANALAAYNSSASFRMISVAELEAASSEISGWLAGVDLTNAAAVREALKKHAVSPTIIDNVTGFLAGKPGATADDVSAYMLRCAMASMTGLYDLFGVPEDALQGLRLFDPTRVTKDKLVKWLQGQDISEDAEGSGSSQQADQSLQRLQSGQYGDYSDAEAFFNAHPELQNLDAAKRAVLEELAKQGKFEEALEFLAHHEILDTTARTQCLQAMIEQAIGRSNWNMAFKLIKMLDASANETKQTSLRKLIRRGLESMATDPSVTKAMIEQWLAQVDPTMSVAEQGYNPQTGTEFISWANERLRVGSEIFDIRERVFQTNPQTGEVTLRTTGGGVTTALAELDAIIDPANTSSTAADRAHALILKAEILRVYAEKGGLSGTDYEGEQRGTYIKMAQTARQAALAFLALRDSYAPGSAEYLYYQSKVAASTGIIGQLIIDWREKWAPSSNGAGGDSGLQEFRSKYQKLVKELAQYIPDGTQVAWTNAQREQEEEDDDFIKGLVDASLGEHARDAAHGYSAAIAAAVTAGITPAAGVTPPVVAVVTPPAPTHHPTTTTTTTTTSPATTTTTTPATTTTTTSPATTTTTTPATTTTTTSPVPPPTTESVFSGVTGTTVNVEQ